MTPTPSTIVLSRFMQANTTSLNGASIKQYLTGVEQFYSPRGLHYKHSWCKQIPVGTTV